MKAQELRLGNLGGTKYDGVLLTGKVISISDGRIVMDLETNDKDYVECHISPFDFNPIPLTEGWLVKLGLRKLSCHNPTFDIDCKEIGSYTIEYTTYESESIENYWRIDLSNNGVCRYVRIDYVHQVQNLYYALTQTELTIK